MDKDYPFIAKCVWLFIIFLCFALTLTQIGSTIGIYLSEPVSLSIKVIRNDSLNFPTVTICGKARFGEKKTMILAKTLAEQQGRAFPQNITFEAAFDYLIDEYGVDVVWTNTSYNVPQMLQKCNIYHNGRCNDFGHWVPTFTLFGLCYSYKLDSSITSAGPYQALYITLSPDDEVIDDKKGWKILVHDPNRNPDLLIQTEGFTVDPNTRADVVLEYRQFKSLKTARNPCNESLEYSVSACEASCIYNMLLKDFPCRLPYMDVVNVPLCHLSTPYNELYRQQESILNDGTNSVFNLCKCPRPCQEDLYKFKLDLRSWRSNSRTTIKVYFEDLNYEHVEEHPAYGVVELLSDIGGNLGLFLGACVVSIFEVGETVICSIARLIKALISKN